MDLLKRSMPAAFEIGSVDGSTVIEVRRLKMSTKCIVVECQPSGEVKRVDSKRGMEFERAKARAIDLAGMT